MTVFLIPSFFILHSLFFPTVARAQLPDCGDFGYEQNGCCNYGDINENPDYHITADDERCNADWCQMQLFGGDFPFGDCDYCNPNVCVRKDGAGGCAGTCNNVCCAGAPPDDDEGDCHMDDENLTTCCPITEVSAPQNLWDHLHNLMEMLGDAFLSTKLPFISLTVRNFKVSEKFDEAIDYYYGKIIENEEGEEEIDPGAFFKLAPPNLLQEELPTEKDKIKKRREWAKWAINTSRESGESGEDALNDGKLRNEAYPWAVTYLRDFLVAIPKAENSTSYQKETKTKLASTPLGNPTPESSGKVLAATNAELCEPPVVEADTKKTCTPDDTLGKDATIGNLWNILQGEGLFPKIVDFDKIGRYTTGDETDSEGYAAQDPHYPDGGFLEIFKLPDEEYEEHNAKGSAGLELKFTLPIVDVGFTIDLGRKDLELRHQGSDTYEREKENGVYAKLSPPGAYAPPTDGEDGDEDDDDEDGVEPPGPPGFDCADGGNAILAPNARQNLLTGRGKTNVCYSPTAIIIHWSGQSSGHSNQRTYSALASRGLSCQYGTDDKSGTNGTWQMLEIFEYAIEKSYCTGTTEYNKRGINIEIAGSNFDNEDHLGPYNPPTPQQYERTLNLTCFFKSQYDLATTQIFGHNEIRTGKPDPGPKFIKKFREDIDNLCP